LLNYSSNQVSGLLCVLHIRRRNVQSPILRRLCDTLLYLAIYQFDLHKALYSPYAVYKLLQITIMYHEWNEQTNNAKSCLRYEPS
jgi:hypothetical protein